MESIDYDLDLEYREEDFDGDTYYKNTFGVTVLAEEHVQEIHLKFDRSNAPYVTTKPIHHSQQVLKTNTDGSIVVCIYVHINFELERLILGFGDSVEVLKPRLLRKRIFGKLERSIQNYS